MTTKFAKLRLLGARRLAPNGTAFAPANDNRRDVGWPARRRPTLVCRWVFDGGLVCRWEAVDAPSADPVLDEEPSSEGIHTSVFVLSYEGKSETAPLAGHRPGRRGPNLLQARH